MNKTKKLVTAALFASLIAVCTAFIKIPTGINAGYVHFGDALIYLASTVLPLPYAVTAAAIGGAFADIMAGATLWAPATAIIKALNVLPFILNKKIAPVLSGAITVAGYFLAEAMLFSAESALASIPFSLIQAVGSAIIYYLLSAIFERKIRI